MDDQLTDADRKVLEQQMRVIDSQLSEEKRHELELTFHGPLAKLRSQRLWEKFGRKAIPFVTNDKAHRESLALFLQDIADGKPFGEAIWNEYGRVRAFLAKLSN